MEELVQRARTHDKEAFQQLVTGYIPDMYKVAIGILKNEEDAADAAQDAILSAWENVGSLRENGAFRGWLMKILINKCNTIYRQRQRTVPDENMPEPEYVEKSYDAAEWREVLNCLEEKYRIVLILFYAEQFKISEIAEMLEINENTVKTRMRAAKEKVCRMLKAEGRLQYE